MGQSTFQFTHGGSLNFACTYIEVAKGQLTYTVRNRRVVSESGQTFAVSTLGRPSKDSDLKYAEPRLRRAGRTISASRERKSAAWTDGHAATRIVRFHRPLPIAGGSRALAEAEAALQRQRGLVLPNAAAFT